MVSVRLAEARKSLRRRRGDGRGRNPGSGRLQPSVQTWRVIARAAISREAMLEAEARTAEKPLRDKRS